MSSASLRYTLKQLQTKILNLSLSTIIGLSGLIGAAPLFMTQTAYAAPATLQVSATAGTDSGDCAASPCATISYALGQASSGDTIDLAAGTYDLTSELDITKPVSIVGQGTVTIHSDNASWNTSNSGKHVIGIEAGTAAAPVTLSNVIIDSNDQSYGVNTYDNAYGVLDNVTIENSKGAGLTVNGSTIVATNLNTTGNSWGAVNVDPGSGVTTPSVFDLSGSGTLAESTQIWSDGSNVNGSATVTVDAPGYSTYKIGGTTAGYFWTDQTLTDAATITANGVTTYYPTISDAVAAATSGETVNVAPGTYSDVELNGSYASNITVEGTGQPTINGLDLTGSTFDGLTFTGFTFIGDSAGYGNFSVTIASDGSYSGLTFSNDTFDGQSQDGRGAIFLNRGFDGFTLQDNTFKNYVSNTAGSVYSIVFAEAQRAAMGSDYTASGNTLTNSNAANFLEAYRWQNVSYSGNAVNTSSYGRLLVWSDDSESLGTVNISGNTVNVAAGKGIGVYYTPNTSVTVSGNSVNGADICVMIDGVSDSTITGNNLSDCSTGILFSQDYSTTLESATVQGNAFVSDTTDIDQTAPITSFNSDASINLSASHNQTTTNGVTTLNGNTPDGTVTADIPNGTTITANGSWDGTLNPPTAALVSIPSVSGYTTTPGIAISAGSDSVTLTFSQAVRLVLPGQAGKLVGFTEPGGSFTQITTVCNGDTQAQADAQLSAGQACYINVGSDLVVWTTHFSTFATYTLTASQANGSGSGSSSAGSSSSSNSGTTTTTTTGSSQKNLVDAGGLLNSQSAGAAAAALNPSIGSGARAAATTAAVGKVVSKNSLKWYWWTLAALFVAAIITYYIGSTRKTETKSKPKSGK